MIVKKAEEKKKDSGDGMSEQVDGMEWNECEYENGIGNESKSKSIEIEIEIEEINN